MATIYDVAKSAGVSAKTVSRVLNKDAPVAKSTREAVEAAMDRLGYVPSFAARSMRLSRSGLVGLISSAIAETQSSPELSGLPEIYIFQGIQDVLKKSGRTLLIADTGGSRDTVPDLVRTFAEHRVEGVVYVAPYHQEITLPDHRGIPHFVIANGFDACDTRSVVPDDYGGQRRLVERLIEIGHRRVAYLTLPSDLVATRERSQAWRDAHEAAGLPADEALLREAEKRQDAPEARRRSIEYALSSVLALKDPPTVICAGNDRLAMQLYGMLRSRGVRVPEDMSIAGYDDYRLISETLYPPLTTVELPYRRIGEVAAMRLLELLDGSGAGPTSDRVLGDVMWRDSVIAPSRNPSRNQ